MNGLYKYNMLKLSLPPVVGKGQRGCLQWHSGYATSSSSGRRIRSQAIPLKHWRAWDSKVLSD
eukprot:6210843-Pyramimonas_sp.AAC.1